MAAAAEKKATPKKESGPKKTVLARTTAIAVLKKAGAGGMKMSDLTEAVLADPAVKKAGVSKGTVSAQVSRDANDEDGSIKRTAPSTYALR